MDDLDRKVLAQFPGKVVRKDLVGPLKGALNVPVYVLEYLLGKYCSSGDEAVIQAGLEEVQRILTEHYVRPDLAGLFKSQVREAGRQRVIDKVKVRLHETEDKYWAELTNLALGNIHVADEWVTRYPKLLAGGVWAIVDLHYDTQRFVGGTLRPFVINELRPIQLAGTGLAEVQARRAEFTREEWIELLLRSIGYEPAQFTERQRMLLLLRLVPMVEANYNLCELGPRGTGKSYVYREISPYAILVSGGETTVPSLFVSHIGRGRIGLVGLWDVVAFDEVAGLRKLSSAAGVQILKDYMESGSFSRGREEITALASMVFIGNINVDIQTAVRTSHLFTPFPVEMQDLALLDRFHAYLPGWEIPKMQPEFFARHYGFVVDFLAEVFRDLRATTHMMAAEEHFEFGSALNQRDTKAVRKTVSGLVKLIHPDGHYTRSELAEYVEFAMEMRRRVKEQLKKMGGIEYWNTAFSYVDIAAGEERFVAVPEQGAGGLIPADLQRPGVVFAVGIDSELGKASLLRIEVATMQGTGQYRVTGAVSQAMREGVRTAYDFIHANLDRFAIDKSLKDYDVHAQVVNLMQAREGSMTSAAFFLAILSALVGRPMTPATVVLGEMTIHGMMQPVTMLGECLQVARENGARRVLLPASNARDLAAIPPDILSNLDLAFFADARDCALKGLAE